MIRSLTELVATEKAKLWHSLSRSAVLFSLAIFTMLAAFGGVVFVLLGIYLSLEVVLEPWVAGTIVGCAMILIAIIALWFIARLISRQGRTATLAAASKTTLATAPQSQATTVPEAVRDTANDILGAANIRTSDILIGALVAGLVLGASARLRQRLFSSLTRN